MFFYDFWILITNSLFLLFFLALVKTIKEKKIGKFFTSFFISILLLFLVKNSFKILRPFPFNHESFGYSFFSGHSLFAFLAFFYLRDNLLYLVWAISIALSRVALGLHYFIDIIVGSIIGLIIPYLVEKNYEKWKIELNKNKKEVLRKLIHVVFYLFILFVFLLNEVYFKVIVLFSLITFLFLNEILKDKNLKEKEKNPLIKPLLNIKREKEKNLIHWIFPLVFVFIVYLLGFKKIVIPLLMIIAIGDGLIGLINVFLKNYKISFIITSITLFLFLKVYLPLNLSLLGAISFIFGDYISKRFNIDDNYLIPIFSFFVLFIFS